MGKVPCDAERFEWLKDQRRGIWTQSITISLTSPTHLGYAMRVIFFRFHSVSSPGALRLPLPFPNLWYGQGKKHSTKKKKKKKKEKATKINWNPWVFLITWNKVK